MKKRTLAKILLALGIGFATLFSGIAFAACDGNGDSGNKNDGPDIVNPIEYTVTFNLNGGSGTVADQKVEEGGLLVEPTPAPTRENYEFEGWYTASEGGDKWNFATDTVTGTVTTLYAHWTEKQPNPKPKNPVIGVVPATEEGFQKILEGDLVELKAGVAVTVDVADGITGKYPVFMAPVECLSYEGEGAMPYPNLVITAKIGKEKYEFSWNTFWGMTTEEGIDFTNVTSITVKANEDVSVVMSLLNLNFKSYYIDLKLYSNGRELGVGLGRENVAENTVLDEAWILNFVADLCVNCELRGIYLDENLTKKVASVTVSDAVAVEKHDEFIDGPCITLYIDLHNFLQTESHFYEDNRPVVGNGRTYYVSDKSEKANVDVDGIVTYLDRVNIAMLDGWTVSYVLLDYSFKDLKAGSAPWSLGVGHYIIRVDASKKGEKTLSAFLFYHVEVEGDGPYPGEEAINILTTNTIFVPEGRMTAEFSADAITVVFSNEEITHNSDWKINYSMISLENGYPVAFSDGVWELGVGNYLLVVTADNGKYGHFEAETYIHVKPSGNEDKPIRLEGISSVYSIMSLNETVNIYVSDIAVLINGDDIRYNGDWEISYELHSLRNEGNLVPLVGNAWTVGMGEYQLFVTANKNNGEHLSTQFFFEVRYEGNYNPFEREIIEIIGMDATFDLEEVVNFPDLGDGHLNEVVYSCSIRIVYSDGTEEEHTLKELMWDVNWAGIQLWVEMYDEVGIYHVTGIYSREFDFSFNIIVTDETIQPEQRSILGIIPSYGTIFYVGQPISEVSQMPVLIIYSDGDHEFQTLGEVASLSEIEALDMNTVGEKSLSVSYEDYSGILTFKVKVLRIIYTFTGTDTSSIFALKGTPITQIDVYENWSAKVTLQGSDEPWSISFGIIGIDEIALTLMFLDGGNDEASVKVIMICDWNTLTFVNLTVDELENDLSVKGVYSGRIDEKDVTVTVFNNLSVGTSFLVYTVDGQQFVLMYYERPDNRIHIYGLGDFTLDESGNTIR